VFNVKYLLASQKIEHPGLIPVYQGRDKIVYFNRLYLPRVRWVPGYRVIKESPAALNFLYSPDFNPVKEVVLEEDPGIPPAGPAAAAKGTNTLTVEKWTLNEMVFKADVVRPSFLVLSEIYYPKWRCYVDGKQVKIFKTDYLFRSVWLAEGRHDVVFRYHNDGLYVLTLLIALSSGLFLIVFILRKRKKYFDFPPA